VNTISIKEVNNMPKGDRTGPMGFGPRTGRGMGYCSGYSYPGFMQPGPGFGFGRGLGSGRGPGFGRGFGRGRGGRWAGLGFYGNPYPPMMPHGQPYGMPYGYYPPFTYPYGVNPTAGYPPRKNPSRKPKKIKKR
jgi:hypothetical protein